MRSLAVAAALVGLALVAAAAPLLTYSLSLAVFGLAHVAVELRYVEARFGPRLSRPVLGGLGLLLAAVVGLRLIDFTGLVDPILRTRLELAAVSLITASVTGDLGLRAGLASVTAVGAALAIGLGAAFAPVATILLLAVLHNWTPVGLVAEATPRSERGQWLGWGVLAFGLLPALLALGPVHALTDGAGLTDLTVLPTGSLEAQLGAFLPRAWHDEPWARRLFSAVAFAQCMHYAAVLGVLPGLAPRRAVGPLTALRVGPFLGIVAAGSALLFAAYAADFRAARSVYGVFASVHAWVELPMLVLALAPRREGSP